MEEPEPPLPWPGGSKERPNAHELSLGVPAEPASDALPPDIDIQSRAAQHIREYSDDREAQPGVSLWIYAIAFVLLLFILALILLATVASAPQP